MLPTLLRFDSSFVREAEHLNITKTCPYNIHISAVKHDFFRGLLNKHFCKNKIQISQTRQQK